MFKKTNHHGPFSKKIIDELNQVIASIPGNIFWQDKEGKFLGCNDNMAKILNLNSPKEMIGKTKKDMMGDYFHAFVWPTDQAVIKNKKEITAQEIGFDEQGNRATYLTNKKPLFDKKGQVIGLIGISIDITERIHEIKQVIASIPGNLFWQNNKGVLLGCNDNIAKIFKLNDPDEIVGKTKKELMGDFYNLVEPMDDAVIKNKKEITVEETGFDEQGNIAIYLTKKKPLFDSKGEVIGLIGTSMDITERKNMEKELLISKEKAEAASQAKSEFLENMRHDIRTPLTSMIGFSELIKNESKEKNIQEYAANLLLSSSALLHFMNEVLEMIRLDKCGLSVSNHKIHIKSLIQSIIDINQTTIAQKKLAFQFNYDNNIPDYLMGDGKRVYRIMHELLVNALKFTEKGTIKLSVELKSSSDEKNILLNYQVSDTGIGISGDNLDNIFLPFNRLNPAYEGIYPGLGLGLPHIKRLLDNLGGEIYVQSELKKGSVFTCLIPFKKPLTNDDFGALEINSIAAPLTNQISLPVTLKQNDLTTDPIDNLKSLIHVLLVEDNKLALMVQKRLFEQLNCTVDSAEHGHEALIKAKQKKYDIIFMDIGLPDIDGCQVTRHIRQLETSAGHPTPIIALTAHIEKQDEQGCLDAGMNAVTFKPISKETVLHIFNTFLSDKVNCIV